VNLFIVDDTTNDVTPFIIKNDGKVGVGTSNPKYKVDILSDTASFGIQVRSKVDGFVPRAHIGNLRIVSSTHGPIHAGLNVNLEGSLGLSRRNRVLLLFEPRIGHFWRGIKNSWYK